MLKVSGVVTVVCCGRKYSFISEYPLKGSFRRLPLEEDYRSRLGKGR